MQEPVSTAEAYTLPTPGHRGHHLEAQTEQPDLQGLQHCLQPGRGPLQDSRDPCECWSQGLCGRCLGGHVAAGCLIQPGSSLRPRGRVAFFSAAKFRPAGRLAIFLVSAYICLFCLPSVVLKENGQGQSSLQGHLREELEAGLLTAGCGGQGQVWADPSAALDFGVWLKPPLVPTVSIPFRR